MDGHTVLHLSPHPDDEILGAGATLLELAQAGARVVNLACGLGRPQQQAQRRAEVALACARAGFELELIEPPLAISGGDDLDAAQQRLTEEIARCVARLKPRVIISPSPHDRHHGHEVVARAVRAYLSQSRAEIDWWVWALWGELPLPNLMVRFGQQRLDRMLHALAAHAGELERSGYDRMLGHRAAAAALLGSERIWGSGSPSVDAQYAELLCELRYQDGDWWLAEPAFLDQRAGLATQFPFAVGTWVSARSVTQQLGPMGGLARRTTR